jgi:hypothetical protein
MKSVKELRGFNPHIIYNKIGYTFFRVFMFTVIIRSSIHCQLVILCFHFLWISKERMDPARLPKITIPWKPEGREKTRPSPKNLESWNIYSHE